MPPPRTAAVVAAVLVGAAAGLGGFVFRYAEGTSYLSADPKACVNCHIMQPQWDGWQKSSHHGVAACADCHLPHDTVPKYLAKAENGWHHSVAFTLQSFEEPIRIKGRNVESLEANCLRCHGELTHPQRSTARRSGDVIPCVHCHATVGHGEKAGLGKPLPPPEKRREPKTP